MKWNQFLESKESDEERSGLDLDHDGEAGEPVEHRERVKAARRETLDFFHKRKLGAAKIARDARAKGGPALLTAWHFDAKAGPYAEVIRAVEADEGKQFFVSKCESLLSRVRCGMPQEDFQKVMGELEVWGEAAARLFGRKS